MVYTIDVQSTKRQPTELTRAVAGAAHATLVHASAPERVGLTVLLTDDDHLRQLNRDYRGEDHPTDVLSFPAGDPMPGDPTSGAYLGDIAIAVPTAGRQAAAKGHALVAELQLLAVHGVLHLLGHDHLEDDEQATMWAMQAAVLATLGLAAIQPTESDYSAEADHGAQ